MRSRIASAGAFAVSALAFAVSGAAFSDALQAGVSIADALRFALPFVAAGAAIGAAVGPWFVHLQRGASALALGAAVAPLTGWAGGAVMVLGQVGVTRPYFWHIDRLVTFPLLFSIPMVPLSAIAGYALWRTVRSR